jgi:hypothetical protein
VFSKSLRRKVLVLICVKALALTLIYYATFAPFTQPEPDGRATAAYLLHGSEN